MRRQSVAISVFAIFFAGVAPAAFAQGNSAVDQYQENIPDASGNVDSGNGSSGSGSGGSGSGSSGSSSASTPVPESTVDELEQSGDDGAAAAALAQETAPESGGTDGDKSNGDKSNGDRKSSSDDSQDETSAVAGSDKPPPSQGESAGASDSGGIGLALPIIFGVALIVALLIFLARRRLSGEPGPA